MKLELPQINILEEAVRLYGLQALRQDAASAKPAPKSSSEETPPTLGKHVYSFGGGSADGDGSMRSLLGGKGAGLAEMARLGVPVPPGFTLPTSVWTLGADAVWPNEVWDQIIAALRRVEELTNRTFGGSERPLFVSVRSGARDSMPGMMETILNLGMTSKTEEALARETGSKRFARACHVRFLRMYAKIVLEQKDADSAGIKGLLAVVPDDPLIQLRQAIAAVFRSWGTERARAYREAQGIPHDLGTACTVQAMVFGNTGMDSGTGVLFTRDPKTGEPGVVGEYLANAQGEDVVAGIRTPEPLDALRAQNFEVWLQLRDIAVKLERHFRDMQDIEFTVERGKLYVLQTRSGKRSARAMARIALDLVTEGVATKEQVAARIDWSRLAETRRPTIKDRPAQAWVAGIGASPGVAVGVVATSTETARKLAAQGTPVVLVRNETDPDDLPGMLIAQGVLTQRGGKTSHAAVVALGLGRPCVVGCGDFPAPLEEGAWLTIDGAMGEVFLGQLETAPPEPDVHAETVGEWFRETPQGQMVARLDDLLAVQVRKLDSLFRYYLFLAVVGELRHASKFSHTNPLIVRLRETGLTFGGKRAAAQDNLARKIQGTVGVRDMLDLAMDVFTQLPWRGGFGGKPWAQITRTLRERYRHIDTGGKEGLPAAVFVDAVFDLEHNNGLCFDKRTEIQFNRYAMAAFLNHKRYAGGAVDLLGYFERYPDIRALYGEAEGLGLIAPKKEKKMDDNYKAEPIKKQKSGPMSPKIGLTCSCDQHKPVGLDVPRQEKAAEGAVASCG